MSLKYLAILLIFPIVHGLYFHIGETERKCFIEEIPDDTMVTGLLKNNFNCSVSKKIEKIWLLSHKFEV